MLHGGEAKDGQSRKSFSIGQMTPCGLRSTHANHPQSPRPIGNEMMLLLAGLLLALEDSRWQN